MTVSTVCNWLCERVRNGEVIYRVRQTSQQIIADLEGKECCLCDRNDRIQFFGYNKFGRL
jgi:hypothetical protein